VPLLVYGLGVDPREAIGASLVTVGATALVGFLQRWRVGLVEMRTGLLFAVAGMTTAPLGSWLAARIPEAPLLLLFAVLMLAVAARMWRKAGDVAERHVLVVRPDEPGPVCRRDPQGVLHWNSRCALLLVGVGLGTGLLAGLFGVGGGFIIVPALVLFSGMGIQRAVGTSLLVIASGQYVGHRVAGDRRTNDAVVHRRLVYRREPVGAVRRNKAGRSPGRPDAAARVRGGDSPRRNVCHRLETSRSKGVCHAWLVVSS
jgi:uncharacterized membrane protein YfcA